ncbi:MAG TPA: EscU/YscU/HrcU family type III secretion system export apparatus switch protein, partial [Oligoflexia bacterium]|nr:EscU/YscU/HrcU family type III secretion system export apparatus switch protein [Oligoflexia bacterium]
MAEYEERSLDDLTEEPSPQRLEELRKKGTVPQSRDLTSTLVLLGVSCALYLFSNMAVSELSTLMREVFSKDLASKLTLE